MEKLNDWFDQWEKEVATMIRGVVLPAENGEMIVATDEICFFGSSEKLPQSMDYLKYIGTVDRKPEVYVFGVKDGELIPPMTWFTPQIEERLGMITGKLIQEMTKLVKYCENEGFTTPTVVKLVVIVKTGETSTLYEFDPLPASPLRKISAADLAFDEWAYRIEVAGSAFKELQEAKEQRKK
jgi:hypothetical protein